jgi:hypothetical protein
VIPSDKALRRRIAIFELKEDKKIEIEHLIETTGFNCAP